MLRESRLYHGVHHVSQQLYQMYGVTFSVNPLRTHNNAEQRTIIQQYGDWYTGRSWVGFYIWYSEEGPGRAAATSNHCTKCNSPPINGQCTNIDVALAL